MTDTRMPAVSVDLTRRAHVTVTPRTKITQLARLLAQRPAEFFDRTRAIVEVRARKRWPTKARYIPVHWHDVAPELARALPGDTSWSKDDPALDEVRVQIATQLRRHTDLPIPVMFDADPVLSRLAYFLTLAIKPKIAVETGVAAGITSAFILAAMERNGFGKLISIDLPPLGVGRDDIGAAVPEALRGRWELVRGTSVRELNRVLPGADPVGLFIHDSLFTRRNSRQEYSLVVPHLAPTAAIVGNRIDYSDAFQWLTGNTAPHYATAIAAEHKHGEQLGLAVYKRGGL
ncbi:MAG TPA: class I SAM-dependent methyltransferase [Tepidisphaeraceae bacterium]|jgi:hypothetical protein